MGSCDDGEAEGGAWGGRAPPPQLRWPFLILLVTLVLAVSASAIAGGLGLWRVEGELRQVTDLDSQRLLELTHVRRLFRSEAVLLHELDRASDPAEAEALNERRASIRTERGQRLARLRDLGLPGQELQLNALVTLHSGGDPRHSVAGLSWEDEVATCLAAVEHDLETASMRAQRVTATSRAVLVSVSLLAVVIGVVLGGLVLRRAHLTARALEESNQRVRGLVEAAPSLLMVIDGAGTLEFLPARGPAFLGLSRARLSKDPLAFIVPVDHAAVHLEVAAILAGEAPPPAPLEVWAAREDGERWRASISLSGAAAADGRVVGVLLQILNVTPQHRAEEERRSLEEQLRRAQRLESVGRLAGGLAHDFNNVLSVVTGVASILESEAEPGSPQAELAENLAHAAAHGASVTRQLLAFAGRQTPARALTDPVTVARQVEQLLGAAVGRQLAVEIDAAADLPECEVDATQLSQALLNLTLNAAHAMGNRGTLRIGLHPVELDERLGRRHPTLARGRYLEITVTDTGHGIPREIQDRVFEPFFTTKSSDQGSGLGLAMVHGIVKSHGGCIELESEVGNGTTFRLYFPFRPPSARPAVVEG